MGADLHLAHVHQPTPPKRKRKGGCGGAGPEEFARLAKRVYTDDRADGNARALLLAVAYAVSIAPREEGQGPLNTAARVLGRGKAGYPRFDELVAADAPRYVPPRSALNWGPSNAPACEAPRMRPYKPRGSTPRMAPERNEDMACGANSHHRVIERDPRTGWVIPHWFCKRHQAHAVRVAEQVKAQNEAAPAPIPNSGGLLPCYFEADWEMVYRRYTGKQWEPPVYGIRADDWPIPGKDAAIHHPRLRLIVGGADLDTPGDQA